MKYELTESDHRFIKFMKDEYEMEPSYFENDMYVYDLKPYPSFSNAIIENIND